MALSTTLFLVSVMARMRKIDTPMCSNVRYNMSSTKKCGQCKKKLGVMSYTCKCERLFCISHLPPQEHQCSFDFKKEAQAVIQKQMDSEPRTNSFERIE